jgi:hypothetical protein
MAWPAHPLHFAPQWVHYRWGVIAGTAAANKVKPAPPPMARIAFGPVAVVSATEEAHEWSPVPPVWKVVEAAASVVAVPITIRFAVPPPEVVSGAALSVTENTKHGLPLPFPSVLANPGRLGPPRFNAADRKTLGIKR